MINWVGMMESGGRRIQRSISIDMTSIKFCDEALMERLSKGPHLSHFINLDKEITKDKPVQKNQNFAGSTMKTNLSLFKEYLENYCRVHPAIHPGMTRIVRFLQSSEKGLPIEIIVFSKFQQVEIFESLQAEIFNQILAILPEFELRIFQNPSGNGLQSTESIQ